MDPRQAAEFLAPLLPRRRDLLTVAPTEAEYAAIYRRAVRQTRMLSSVDRAIEAIRRHHENAKKP